MDVFNRWFRFTTNPVSLVTWLSLVLLAFMVWDKPLAEYFYQLNLKERAPLVANMTHLGIAEMYLLGLPMIALFFRYIHRQKINEMRFWFLWCCVMIPSFIAYGLKHLLGRARPILWIDSHVFGFFGWERADLYHSCPSGHTTALMAMMLAMSILWPRLRWVWLGLAGLLIASRVVLAHHYLSDVIISCFLVFIELQLFFILLKQIALEKNDKSDLKRLYTLIS